MARVLMLSVGTGDLDRPEESLLSPLRKSIAAGTWERVVLLPSALTHDKAERLREEANDQRIEVRPLPRPGAEDDADACFQHFAAEIERLLAEGFAPADICADFTRGTKAMSAGLVLAAVAYELSQLRYITGKRDRQGMVIAGSEQLQETRPAAVLAQRRMDLARQLVASGAFAAALEILPDPDHPFAVLCRLPPEMVRAARAVAAFYAAWDRLDYRSATAIALPEKEALPLGWQPLWPGPARAAWVRRLASQPPRDQYPAMAAWLRQLAVDLLANAERRVHQNQFEDALVRAHRVAELVIQARLFDHDIDSEALPEAHPAVRQVLERRRHQGKGGFIRLKSGLQASREDALELLRALKDPGAQQLLQLLKGLVEHTAPKRNKSLLTHGYAAQAPQSEADWRQLLSTLWDLVKADRAGMSGDLAEDRAVATYPEGMPGTKPA